MQFLDRPNGIFPGTQLAHDLDSWVVQKNGSETAPRDFVIIDENESKGIHLCIYNRTSDGPQLLAVLRDSPPCSTAEDGRRPKSISAFRLQAIVFAVLFAIQ